MMLPLMREVANGGGAELAGRLIEVFSDSLGPRVGDRENGLLFPTEIGMLTARLLGQVQDTSIYCPFAGSALLSALLAASGSQVFAEVESPPHARLLILLGYIGGWRLEVRVSQPVRNPAWVDGGNLCEFDAAAAVPPFGLKYDAATTAQRPLPAVSGQADVR